jgi:hypothetical protein
MSGLVTEVAARGIVALLALSVVLQIVERKQIRAVILRAHVIPRPGVAPFAALLVTIELMLLLGASASLNGLAVVDGRFAFAAITALFCTYAAFTVFLLRRRPGAACGCFGSADPTTPATALRAAILSATAAYVAYAPPDTALAWPTANAAIVWLAGATFAVLAWSMPAALDASHVERNSTMPGGAS